MSTAVEERTQLQPLPTGHYEAGFWGGEREIEHELYRDAVRFGFEIAEGEHTGRIVSCTIDAAESGAVYQPRSLWVDLKEMVAAPSFAEYIGRACTIFVAKTGIGTNRVESVRWRGL
jgi:hypothetical protein